MHPIHLLVSPHQFPSDFEAEDDEAYPTNKMLPIERFIA